MHVSDARHPYLDCFVSLCACKKTRSLTHFLPFNALLPMEQVIKKVAE